MASVLACLFDFCVASSALVVLLRLSEGWLEHLSDLGSGIARHDCYLCLGAGHAHLGCELFFRDVRYMIEIFLTFGIFFTPVFYDIRMFGERGKWLLLNPIAPLLEGLSDCVVRHQSPDLQWYLYSSCFQPRAYGLVLFFSNTWNLPLQRASTGAIQCLMSRSAWTMSIRNSRKARYITPCAISSPQ